MMSARDYLAKQITPFPLPTKDGGVLRTIGDARAYMVALPKTRWLRSHWQRATQLILNEAGAAAVSKQVHLALFTDGKLDVDAVEQLSSARRWRREKDDCV
jgi:hypothetical protein